MYRINRSSREKIANNIVDFMVNDTPLLQESVSFIYNWVMSDGSEKTKAGSFSVKGNANDRTVAMTIGGLINLESDTLSTAKRLKNSVRKKRKLTAIFRTA